MSKKRASSSASRSKAPIGRSAGRGTTCGGLKKIPQSDDVNGGQPQVVARERVQEQVVKDTPLTVLTVILPVDVVIRLLNVLEALVANNGGLP
ncbi:hypothetical protein HAX54_031104, partial [Datura stramonium]|nr:hypothetical protein [Datura stramonium]